MLFLSLLLVTVHSVKPKTLQKIQETHEKSDALGYTSNTFSSTLVV